MVVAIGDKDRTVAGVRTAPSRSLAGSPQRYDGAVSANKGTFGASVTITVILGLSAGYQLTGENLLLWVVGYLASDWRRSLLVAYWIAVIGGSVVGYIYLPRWYICSKNKFIHNLRRKYYHLMVIAMFIPGFLWQPYMMSLSLAVALIGLWLVEMIRVFNVGSLGSRIHYFMSNFTDARDAGVIITSHFYLLVGCALPVWMGGHAGDRSSVDHWIAPMSGVLTLGVADAVASVVGQKWGTRRWFGGSKTVEGSVGFVASLVVAVVVLDTGLAAVGSTWPRLSLGNIAKYAAVCGGSGTLEAVSTQNDNLVVPLFTFAAANLIR
ncbi:hypothetical protein EV182_005876 [Spiromyces aspiralis]|uniref:Uncharacterized protein n=1 Tax=Spiromyces aspiralis TaxID=68401 RepID=A0ACC1HCV2_9FUNG|nr:hypothetical protein EV182_005876 [Spiromyces aspiralis]